MTWFAQVRHVATRNVVALNAVFLGWLAVLALTAATALEVGPLGQGGFPVSEMLFWLASLLVVATVVLEDPVTKVDAFWATLPLRASAVAVAKVVLVLVVTTVTLLVSQGVRRAWGLPSSALPATGTVAALGMLWFLVPNLLIASACRDLRTFVGWVLAMVALPTMLMPWIRPRFGELSEGMVITLRIAGLLLAVALLVARYRQAGDRRGARFLAFAAGVALLVMTPFLPAAVPAATTAAHLGRTGVALVTTAQPTCERARNWFVVPISVDAPSGWRVDLRDPSLTITTVSGERIQVRNAEWGHALGVWGPLLPARPDGAPWTVLEQFQAPPRTDIAFTMPAAQLDRVCGAVQHLALDLDVAVTDAREVLRLPLTSGATAVVPGARGRMFSVDERGDSLMLQFRVSRLIGERGADDSGRDLTYAVVDDSTGHALATQDVARNDGFQVTELPGLLRTSSGRVSLVMQIPSTLPADVAQRMRRGRLLVSSTLHRTPLRIHREGTFQPVP